MKDYNEIVDNKINNAMEKIKNDNENMWIKSVLMKDKVTDPEEIKKILTDLRPSILSKGDSYKEILEINSNDEKYYAIPKLNINYKSNSIYDYGNNYNNQQDPGPDINSTKSSKNNKTEKIKSNKKWDEDEDEEGNINENTIHNDINEINNQIEKNDSENIFNDNKNNIKDNLNINKKEENSGHKKIKKRKKKKKKEKEK